MSRRRGRGGQAVQGAGGASFPAADSTTTAKNITSHCSQQQNSWDRAGLFLALSHLRSARRPCWETLVSWPVRGPEPGRATGELDHCKGPACFAPPLGQPQPGLRLKPDASHCSG